MFNMKISFYSTPGKYRPLVFSPKVKYYVFIFLKVLFIYLFSRNEAFEPDLHSKTPVLHVRLVYFNK